MDILKSVLGIGNSIGNFFNKKKKDLEDTIQTFIPKQQAQPVQQAPQLSFQRPQTAQPPKPIAAPKLSFQVPNTQFKQAPAPQQNPLTQWIQSGLQKLGQQHPGLANIQTEEVPYMGKTITTPKIPLATEFFKRVVVPQAENVRKGVSSAVRIANPNLAGLQGKPVTLNDVGNVAGGIGSINPIHGVIAGLFSEGINRAGNLITKNPQNEAEAYKRYREGFDFGAKLAPVSEAVAGIKGIPQVAAKLADFAPKWKDAIGGLASNVIKEGTKGAIYGGITGQSPIKTGLEFAPYGILGAGKEAEQVKMARFNASAGMHPEDINLASKVYGFLKTSAEADKKPMEGGIKLPSTLEVEQQWGKQVDQLAEHYLDTKTNLKNVPFAEKVKALYELGQHDTANNTPFLGMGLVNKESAALNGPAATKANKSALTEAIQKAGTQEEAIKNFDDSMAAATQRFNELKASSPTEAVDKLKRVRAAINQSMHEVAGVDPKNGKFEAKVFGENFKNPEVAPLLEKMQSSIQQIDDTLAANGTGVGAKAPLSELDQTIKNMRDQKLGIKPQGNETIRLMDTPASELSLEDKLKKFAIDKSASRGMKEIQAEGKTSVAPVVPETTTPDQQLTLDKVVMPKKTAEQIQQEVMAGKYQPRTSLVPSPEKPVLTVSDKAQLTKMGYTPEDISVFEKDIAGGDKGALQSLKDFNDQMKSADQSMGLKTPAQTFAEQSKMADEALKTKYNLATDAELSKWKLSHAKELGDMNYKAGNEALKETYDLKTPEQMATAQQKIADSVNQLEELNKASGLPPEGTPTAPAYSNKDNNIFDKMKNLANAIVVESRSVLNGMGEAGQQAAKRIDNMYNGAERMTGGLVADYGKAIEKLEPNQIENVLKSLDGQAVTLNSQEQIAASNLRNILNGVAKQSSEAGVEIKLPDGTKVPFTPKENYIPHMIDEEKLKAFRDQTIKYMVDTKQIPDVTTASTFIDDMIKGTPMAEAYQRAFGQKLPARFGNIEMARIFDFPSEILRYDAKLLPDYLAGAASRIHQVLNFGPDNEIMTNLLNNMARSGYDAKTAEGILNTNLKLTQENPTLKQAVGSIKQVQATMKLGLGAITNAGQSTNTATKYGIANTIKNMFKANSPESQDFALRTGAVVDSALKEIEDEAKGGKGILDKITAPGFNVVEKFNRVVAANAGKDYANSTFQQLLKNPTDSKAAEALSQMIDGFKPEEAIKRGALTTEELLKAGQKAVNVTQFKTRPIDLPPTWSSSFGRVLTQFKSFSYKHAQFIANDVIKPAFKGDVAPLARYIALGLVVGEGIADAKAAIRRRDRPTNPAERVLDNMSTVGGMGLAQDAISAAQRGPEAVLSWIAGPTLSDAAKLAGGIGLALQGKPKTITRMAVGNIPIVGQPLANTIFPATGAYKSRTPDLIQEAIGMVPDTTASAAESAQGFSNTLDFNNLDEQKIKDQITEIGKQKKDIIAQAGFMGIGKMSDEEKNTKLATLDAEEKTLKANLKLQGIQDYLGPNTADGIDKYKYSSEQQKWARTVYESGLPEEKKTAIFKQMGIKPEDAKYDSYANMPDETKSKFLIENLSAVADHNEVLNFLANARKESISGKIFVTNSNLQDLEDEGIISDSERKQLAKLKIKVDKDGNIIKSQTGSGTGGLTKSKLNAMISKAKAYGKQFAIGDAPKIDTNISTKTTTTKQVAVPKQELSAAFFTSDVKVPKAPTLEELFQKNKTSIPTTNITKAKALVQRARSGGQGNPSIKLSQSFFKGGRA